MRSHADHRATGDGDGADARVPAAGVSPSSSGRLILPLEERIRGTHRWLVPMRDWYFRAEVSGLDNVPGEPSLLVGNHDGGYFPPDGICLAMAWHERHQFRRPLFWLMHDFPFRLTHQLSTFLYAHGILPASRRNFDRVFDAGQSLFVYPGGAHEAFRPYRHRRKIELGHRTGFVAAALKRKVPIVPIVSVGAHDTLFVISRGSFIARRIPIMRRLRSDVMPIWFGLPWGIGFGPLPHLPLPSKVKVSVLAPIRLWDELGSSDSSDERVLRAGLEIVRGRMQIEADRLYDARKYPVLG